MREKDIELLKVQMSHEKILQGTIFELSSMLAVFLALLSLSFAFPLTVFDEITKIVIRIICIVIVSGLTASYIKSILRRYEQKFKRISNMLEDVKQGKELPKLEDIAKELSQKKQ